MKAMDTFLLIALAVVFVGVIIYIVASLRLERSERQQTKPPEQSD